MNSLSLFAEEFTMTSPCGGLCTAVIGLNIMRFQIGSDSLSLCKLQACWQTWRLFLVTGATEGSLGNFSHFKMAACLCGCSGPEKWQIWTRKTTVEWSPLLKQSMLKLANRNTPCAAACTVIIGDGDLFIDIPFMRRLFWKPWCSSVGDSVSLNTTRSRITAAGPEGQVEPKLAALENLHRSCFPN